MAINILNRAERADAPFQVKDLREEIIDVAKAEKYLAMNHPTNRERSTAYVEALSRDMIADNFKYVPVAIIFDWDGYLRDGQHRLAAIIQTGIPQKLLVWENCDPEVFKNLDQGQKRSISQSFYSAGAKYVDVTAAVIKILYRLQAHDPHLYFTAKPTTNEALDLWTEIGGNEFLIPYIQVGDNANKQGKMNPSVCAVLKMIHDIEDAEMSDRFWTNVTDLRDVTGKNDPSYSIVNFLRDEKDRRKALIPATRSKLNGGAGSITQKENIGWIHIAWQYYCEGKTLSAQQASTKFKGKYAVEHLDRAILDMRKTIELNPIGTMPSLKK